ncbi:MAG: hypothetical protein IPI49_25440 [Myxococcales bacterium]|nr:hypothetical protein [Myxococcales bacterium]
MGKLPTGEPSASGVIQNGISSSVRCVRQRATEGSSPAATRCAVANAAAGGSAGPIVFAFGGAEHARTPTHHAADQSTAFMPRR